VVGVIEHSDDRAFVYVPIEHRAAGRFARSDLRQVDECGIGVGS
jgi:hypothetical protein